MYDLKINCSVESYFFHLIICSNLPVCFMFTI